jgi:hypothetical protein
VAHGLLLSPSVLFSFVSTPNELIYIHNNALELWDLDPSHVWSREGNSPPPLAKKPKGTQPDRPKAVIMTVMFKNDPN